MVVELHGELEGLVGSALEHERQDSIVGGDEMVALVPRHHMRGDGIGLGIHADDVDAASGESGEGVTRHMRRHGRVEGPYLVGDVNHHGARFLLHDRSLHHCHVVVLGAHVGRQGDDRHRASTFGRSKLEGCPTPFPEVLNTPPLNIEREADHHHGR